MEEFKNEKRKKETKKQVVQILEQINMGDGYADTDSYADEIYNIILPKGSVVWTENEHKQILKDLVKSNKEVEKATTKKIAEEVLNEIKGFLFEEEKDLLLWLEVIGNRYGVKI